jgi:hypothetical protein
MTDAQKPQIQPQIILLCRDLIFATKIQGTAQALGIRVKTVSNVSAATESLTERDPAHPPTLVLVDLGEATWNSPENLSKIRAAVRPNQAVLCGFGPHVDTASLAAAAKAGFNQVLPRSQFSATLPVLLRKLAQPAAESQVP